MKVIEFDITDQVGFDACAYKIHNALLTSELVYSADSYALFSSSPKNEEETKVRLIIDEQVDRYPVIYASLTTDEQNSIITIE
jgi:hypothetical protein